MPPPPPPPPSQPLADSSQTLKHPPRLDLPPLPCSLPPHQLQRSDPLPRQDSSPGLLPQRRGISADWEDDNYSSSSSSHSIITHEEASSHEQKTEQTDLDSSDSLATHWTDDKHMSYLTFMEENFVKDMYEREYCAVDVCGHGTCHHNTNTVAHRQPNVQEFKSWKNGDWQQRRSLPRQLMPWALFQNPWISHFRHSASSHAVPGDSATATKTMRKAEKTPLHLQENEEVESRQLEEAPNAITQKKSHRQSPSPTTMIHNHETNQAASGSMMVESPNHHVSSSETQYLTSFIKPRKRNLLSDSKQWRLSTRQKFCGDGHTPTSDSKEV